MPATTTEGNDSSDSLTDDMSIFQSGFLNRVGNCCNGDGCDKCDENGTRRQAVARTLNTRAANLVLGIGHDEFVDLFGPYGYKAPEIRQEMKRLHPHPSSYHAEGRATKGMFVTSTPN